MFIHRFGNIGFDVTSLVWFIMSEDETRVGLIVGQETEIMVACGEDKVELDKWLCNELCPEDE